MSPLCTVWGKFQEPLPLSLPSSPSSSNSVFALAPTLLSPALSKWSNTRSAPDGQQQRFCQGRPAWGQAEPQELPSETLLRGLQPPLRRLAMAQEPLNTSVTHPRGLAWGGPAQAPAPAQHGGLPGGRGRSYVPSSLTAACNIEEKVVSQPSGP